MLGSAGDLTAVLSVLDRLANELEENRRALDTSLASTDDIGADIPLGLISPENQADLTVKVRQEMKECEYLQKSVDNNMKEVVKATQLARRAAEIDNARTTCSHKSAGQELIGWQTEVEKLADECADLAASDAAIDRRLAELYTKLKVTAAKGNNPAPSEIKG